MTKIALFFRFLVSCLSEFIQVAIFSFNRDVAQSGRALRSGRRDRVFKSLHPDQEYQALTLDFCKCFFIA